MSPWRSAPVGRAAVSSCGGGALSWAAAVAVTSNPTRAILWIPKRIAGDDLGLPVGRGRRRDVVGVRDRRPRETERHRDDRCQELNREVADRGALLGRVGAGIERGARRGGTLVDSDPAAPPEPD